MCEQPLDGRFAIERFAPPRLRKVTPFSKLPARHSQLLHGWTALPRIAPSQPRERTPQSWRRIAQCPLEPLIEGAIENPPSFLLGELFKGRIHARLHRTLPQNLRAESMNRADGGFFQRLQRLLQTPPLVRVRSLRPRLVEFLPQPDLQLTGRLVRERDGDNAIDRGQALGQHLHNASHQLGRLAGSRRRFHDEALFERFADRAPCRLVNG